jgi:hypothetical protein
MVLYTGVNVTWKGQIDFDVILYRDVQEYWKNTLSCIMLNGSFTAKKGR